MSGMRGNRMAITEEAVQTVATVEVNDGCEVELWQWRKRVRYTPGQARELAEELLRAAGEAVQVRAEYLEEDARQRAQRTALDGEGIY